MIQNDIFNTIKVGDIVELVWSDVCEWSNMDIDDILKEVPFTPKPTYVWGRIVKMLPESLVLAHEVFPIGMEGSSASAYPYNIIDEIRVLK
jgi:hypothetical protein